VRQYQKGKTNLDFTEARDSHSSTNSSNLVKIDQLDIEVIVLTKTVKKEKEEQSQNISPPLAASGRAKYPPRDSSFPSSSYRRSK